MPRNTATKTAAAKKQPQTAAKTTAKKQAAPAPTQSQTKAPKRGKTLASKFNDALYRTLANDLLGFNDQPGVLATVLSQGDYSSPEEYETVLREWLDDRFGKTHKRSGFVLFSASNRAKVVKDLDTKDMGQVASELGARWKKLSETDRAKWNDEAKEYNKENAVRDFTPAPRRNSAGSTTETASKPAAKATKAKAQPTVTDADGSDSSEISSDSE